MQDLAQPWSENIFCSLKLTCSACGLILQLEVAGGCCRLKSWVFPVSYAGSALALVWKYFLQPEAHLQCIWPDSATWSCRRVLQAEILSCSILLCRI